MSRDQKYEGRIEGPDEPDTLPRSHYRARAAEMPMPSWEHPMNLKKFDLTPPPEAPQWVGMRELCELRPFSAPTVRRNMNRANGIPFRKLGRKILFNLIEVDAWLTSQPAFNIGKAAGE